MINYAAKIQQKFGIYKHLGLKIKFIYIFIVTKTCYFTFTCDRTFGGNPPEGKGRAEGISHKKNDIHELYVIFF